MKGFICVYSRITGLLKELKAVSPNLRFCEVFSDRDPNLKNTEIIIGDFDLLAPHLYNLPCSTRWVQGTWAGVDKVLSVMDPNKLLPYIITRFSGNHFGKIMSEYVLYSIINNERQFEIIRANQKTKDWLTNGKIASYRTISDLNIGILGIGHIGSFIGEILHKLGAKIFGYGRRPKLNMGEASYLSSYYNNKVNLPDFLKSCDYLINILPNTSETVGLLNGGILENCKGN